MVAKLCYTTFINNKEDTMYFNTLNEALESENLLHTWDISFPPINYGETFSYTYDDGTKYGHFISIYRTERGRYESPIHYARG